MKVLFISPHLSTGGMPAFLLKRIQALQTYSNVEIYVIEWKCYSPQFVVQRNQIQNLIGDNFYHFGGNLLKQNTIVDFCYKNQIDIIHIEEIPEGFDGHNPFHPETQKSLYNTSHPWKIIETCHNIYFNPDESKICEPDAYACVTPFHVDKTFKQRKAKKSLIPFPVDPTTQHPQTREELLTEIGYLPKGEFHIVNIGLWTSGKNQKYALDLAQKLYDKYGFTYIFHFIGNQAPNFQEYWKPLMSNLPPNVLIWGERDDTSKFLKISDLMLFTSTWECNPIVLKEAISNNLKIMANNLDHYGDEYLPFITPLTNDLHKDMHNILDIIHSPVKYKLEDYKNSVKEFAQKHIDLYQNLIDSEVTRK